MTAPTVLELAAGPMVAALWRVVVFGLLLGAGLPAVFALGLRLLSPGVASAGGDGAASVVAVAHPSMPRRIAAWCCFAVVGVAVVGGIVFLVAGGH